MTQTELTLKIDRMRWWLLSEKRGVFYGSLLMGLADVIGNPHGETACTDGKRIFWHPEFLEKLSEKELRFVGIHETLHPAHGHLWRFPADGFDHETANKACDYEINGIILKGFGDSVAMPAGGLYDPRFDNMAAEEIYKVLAAEKQKQSGDDGKPGANGSPSGDDGQAGDESRTNGKPSAKPGASGKPANDPCGDYCAPAADNNAKPGANGAGHDPAAMADSLRQKWERAIIQAAQAAQAAGCGDIPGDMAAELQKIACVNIDWKAETADFVKSAISTKNDWTRGNRRHLWQSVIYPSRKADALGKIFVACDVSGSVFHRANEFKSIIAQAAGELNCGLILCDFDTRITSEIELAPGDELPLTAAGGGGTDFKAVFERAAELMESGEKIAGVVVLTDLDGGHFPADVQYPLLTVCTGDDMAPAGRTIKIV